MHPQRSARRAPRRTKFEHKYGMTPEEFHRRYAFPPGVRCGGCRSPKVAVRAITMVPLDELRKRDPRADYFATHDPLGFAKTLVPLKHGPHVRIATVYACSTCAPELERQAARGPSWAVVEFDRGPGPDKPQVGWDGGNR